jgi:chloramphenicol O-acetyltransferase type B
MLKKILKIFRGSKNKLYKFAQLNKVLRHKGELYIGGYTTLSKNTILGKNPNFNGMKILGTGRVTFGDNFHSGYGCEIITSNHNFDNGNKIPYDETFITKDVVIGDNVWFGNHVTVLGGVSIGEGAIIQAKALVHKDVPDYAIVGGNPCDIIKFRNIEHYKKLKSEKKFH